MFEGSITKETLAEAFGSEIHYNISNPDEDAACFPDGTYWVICTNWAAQVKRVFGSRCEIWGFSCEDNPGTDMEDEAEGHDFAIVDGRFLVDGWVLNVGALTEQTVFDLEDPDDLLVVKKIYGARSNWERLVEFETELEQEGEAMRVIAMTGTSFDIALAPTLQMTT